jgi:hypothetical protein
MHTTLPIVVEETDVGLFYALLANYHADKSAFRIEANNLGKRLGRTISSPVESRPEPVKETEEGNDGETQSLYAYVTENCSCGSCYGRLARPDRVPWRSTGNGKFINSKHGNLDIKNCNVKRYSGIGYIYVSPAQDELDAKHRTRDIRLKKSMKDAQHEEDLKKELREQARIVTEVEKQKAEHSKIKNEMVLKPHSNKLAAQKAELADLESQNNIEYAEYRNEVDLVYRKVHRYGGKPSLTAWKTKSYDFSKIPGNKIRDKIMSEILGPYKFSKSVELQTLRNILRNK